MTYLTFSKELYEVFYNANTISQGNSIEPIHILIGICVTKNLTSMLLGVYKKFNKFFNKVKEDNIRFKFSKSSLLLISNLLKKNRTITTTDVLLEILKSHINNFCIKYFLKYIKLTNFNINHLTYNNLNFNYIKNFYHSINFNYDNIIGRSSEIDKIIHVLNFKIRNNIILIGESGVGRFSIIKGVYIKIKFSENNKLFIKKEFYVFDLTNFLINIAHEDINYKITHLYNWLSQNNNIILVIPNLENNNTSDIIVSIFNIIFFLVKQYRLQIIITTDLSKFSSVIENNSLASNSYEILKIQDLPIEDMANILKFKKKYLEHEYKIKISDIVFTKIIHLNNYSDIKSPTKLLELMHMICYKFINTYPNIIHLTDYYLNKLISNDLYPFSKNNSQNNISYINLKNLLQKQIFGHKLIINKISSSLKKSLTGFKSKNKPIGSWLLCGPSGTGKTELAKSITYILFGEEKKMIRFDMSEFMEKHSVSKLIGSPPGYVGYEDKGLLTNLVSKTPYCLLLFDEIEKAHPDVLNIMLQLLDDGRLTDSTGHTTDFSNTIIIFTSNLGCPKHTHEFKKEFEHNFITYKVDENDILENIKKYFKPELLNRIQEILIFQPLRFNDLLLILDKFIDNFLKDLKIKKLDIKIKIHEDLKKYLVKLGMSPIYGARPLKRIFDELIVEPTVDIIIRTKIKHSYIIYYTLDKNNKILYNLNKLYVNII